MATNSFRCPAFRHLKRGRMDHNFYLYGLQFSICIIRMETIEFSEFNYSEKNSEFFGFCPKTEKDLSPLM